MAWNSNVPKNVKEKFKDSQPKLNENFEEINTFIGEDHFSFGIANEGKHAHVKAVKQRAINIPTTEVDEVAFFSKWSGELARPELAFLGESSLPANAIGFSKPYGDFGTITRLPSGIILFLGDVYIPNEFKIGQPALDLDLTIQTEGTFLGFNNVYWAALFIGDSAPLRPVPSPVESDSIAYYWGTPSPNVLRFALWQRSEYNVFGVAETPCPASLIVIGD